MDLELEIDNGEIEYKLERENDVKNYFNEKIKEKKKEWEEQIERAKWKTPVQAYGELKCENGHEYLIIFCIVINVMKLYIGLIQMKDMLYAKDAMKLEK